MARGVIPAQARTQLFGHFPLKSWIPAFAGMTGDL
jgi:hypothetical protein